MTGFLTENAGRAYPLARQPDAAAVRAWTRPLVDACVYTSAELDDAAPLSVLSAAKGDGSMTFAVGVPREPDAPDAPDASDASVAYVTFAGGQGGFRTAYGESADHTVKALLTASGPAVDAALSDETLVGEKSIGIPLAHRCCGGRTRQVEAIEAYSVDAGGDGPCACAPRGWTSGETPAATLGGAVTLAAGDGVDLEVVELAPLSGPLLRISAIAAPAEAEQAAKRRDIMIRGDACFTVETLPGVRVEDGRLVDAPGHGVVRLGNVCKPCCQCDDYMAAVRTLRAADTGATAVKTLLDDAKERYDEALAAFEAAKEAIEQQAASSANVHASASATVSGGVYGGSTAKGSRQKLTAVLTVTNMATRKMQVGFSRDTVFNLLTLASGGYDSLVKMQWAHASADASAGGAGTVSGNAAQARTLGPGDSLTVSAVYAKTATSNEAPRPAGMKASYTVTPPGGPAEPREVDIL